MHALRTSIRAFRAAAHMTKGGERPGLCGDEGLTRPCRSCEQSPRPGRVRDPPPHRPLLSQLLGKQIVYELLVRLALEGFHDLADEEAYHALLAGAVVLDRVGVGGDPRVN